MQTRFLVSFVAFFLIFVGTFICVPTSDGALIQYEIEGVVAGSRMAKVSVGDIWSANFVIDTNTSDSSPASPTDGMYYMPLTFDVAVGSFFTRHYEHFRLGIANDYTSGDAVGITAPSPSSPEVFDILLIDYEGTVLGSDAIPSFLSLSDFEYKTMFFAVPAQGYFAQFVGTVTSVNVIPEPSTILLLGAGLAGVGMPRRRFNQ